METKQLSDDLWKIGEDLIYLASCALQGRAPLPERLDKMEYERIYRMAKSQSMRAVTYYALENVAKDSEIFAKWKEACYKAIRKNMLFDLERKHLEDFMEENGIWYMPLKGTLLKERYPKAGMREMADNDILFDPAFRKNIHDFMVLRGYEDKHYREPIEEDDNVGVHDNYYKKPIYSFEMHYALFHGASGEAAWITYYKNVKDRLVKGEDAGCRFCFTDEDFYVYMVTHASNHFFGAGHGIRNLMDVAVYLDTTAPLDWAYIEQELETLGLKEHESIVRSLADKIFKPEFWEKDNGTEGLSAQERELLEICFSSGTYGTDKRRVENSLKKINGGNRIRFADRCRYLLKRLFADKEVYLALYPQLRKRSWLLPFCVVHRMLRGALTAPKRLWNEMKYIWKVKE